MEYNFGKLSAYEDIYYVATQTVCIQWSARIAHMTGDFKLSIHTKMVKSYNDLQIVN